jgi:hypothetical protein
MMANTGTSGSLPNEPLTSGVILQNRYEIERLLGGGGMGMVYLAHEPRLRGQGDGRSLHRPAAADRGQRVFRPRS